jgi:predicted DNA-binding protein (MmcQ/YjbR family)
MNAEDYRAYCLSKPNTTESFPFDETTLVFKVDGKMFALISLDETPCRIALKCDPDKAEELRQHYSSVIPAWHMNKKHWNNVFFDGTIEDELLREWTDQSYDLVGRKSGSKRR